MPANSILLRRLPRQYNGLYNAKKTSDIRLTPSTFSFHRAAEAIRFYDDAAFFQWSLNPFCLLIGIAYPKALPLPLRPPLLTNPSPPLPHPPQTPTPSSPF